MELTVPFHGAYSRMEASAWVNARVSGIVGLEPGALVVQARELRQRFPLSPLAALGGTPAPDDDATTTATLPLEDVAAVEFLGRWLRAPRLLITVKRMELLDRFPWADGARLKLAVRRRDRATAAELALTAATALIDRDLARLESTGSAGEIAP